MTRSKAHIGSHNNHARPDAQMGRVAPNRYRWHLSSNQRQILQRIASAKRRQRDRRHET